MQGSAKLLNEVTTKFYSNEELFVFPNNFSKQMFGVGLFTVLPLVIESISLEIIC